MYLDISAWDKIRHSTKKEIYLILNNKLLKIGIGGGRGMSTPKNVSEKYILLHQK